ncbi:MAG TPA: tetratricopeptide repeat protein [Magnetospirillaceae bacterium]|jgi:tetratricopeptide (TPR) repeat protein
MRRILLALSVALAAWTLSLPAPGSIAPGFTQPARADQKDKRLPALFKRLKAAPDPDAAVLIESDIWKIWFETGDKDIDAMMGAGQTAMEGQDFQGALAAFNAIIKKRPDFAEGWNRRATLYYEMGEYGKSLADIAQTLKLEPHHIGAISGMGLIDIQLEKFEDAEKAYLRVLAISPQDLGAQRNLDAVREIIKKKSI